MGKERKEQKNLTMEKERDFFSSKKKLNFQYKRKKC
jgi:hypothetical protein